MAREVAWVASMPGATLVFSDGTPSSVELVGHLDDEPSTHGDQINGHLILGGADWLQSNPGHAVIIAVGKPSIRKRIVKRLREFGATFPTLLSPDTVIGGDGSIGTGVITLPGVVITTNVTVGDFVLLNPNVSISHDARIGDYCSLGPGVNLAGNVHVGAGTDIGTGASAIPGSRIGEDVVIGAGACVVHNIPPRSTAVGVPARVLRTA